MDRDIWKVIQSAIKRVCRKCRRAGRKPRFSEKLIVGMYLWSVWHDRCLSWACDKSHYGDLFRPRKLPSISQFSRRVREDHFQQVLLAVHRELARDGFCSPISYLDGKPLTVSPVSKDPDARRGYITGGFAKGYKLHAIIGENRKIVIWSVMPLNQAEQTVALEMSQWLAPGSSRSLVLADSNFDSAPLHKALDQRDWRLLTPLKSQQRVKDGVHHPVTLRQMGSQRREAIEVHKHHPEVVRFVLRQRNNAEGVFSVLSVALHVSRPPAYVRRLERVRRWTGAKILLYNARLSVQAARAKAEAQNVPEKLIA
jgi:hypothetical protein